MKYICTVCGYVFDEEKEGKPFSSLEKCPLCGQPVSKFQPEQAEEAPAAAPAAEEAACGLNVPGPAAA